MKFNWSRERIAVRLIGWLALYLLGDKANDDLRHILSVALNHIDEDEG